MTVEMQTNYFGGRYSTKGKVVEPGTTFRWDAETEDGERVEQQTLRITDPDTMVFTQDPDSRNEVEEYRHDDINSTWFPPMERVSLFDRIVRKDVQFYWYPSDQFEVQGNVPNNRKPSEYLLWEQQ